MTRLSQLAGFVRVRWGNVVVRNTAWTLVGRGTLSVIQAAYFIIIARKLGPSGYGAFVGVVALAAIISPFVGLGTSSLLVKNVARDRQLFMEYWGNTLGATLVSGAVLFGGVLVLARYVLPRSVPVILVLLIGVADLLLYRIANSGAVAFQALERLGTMAQLNVIAAAFRLAAAVALFWFRNPGPVTWAYLYLASSAAASLFIVLFVNHSLGLPKLALQRIRPELAEGLYFSISLSAENIYNDIDKAALAKLSTLSAAGTYGAAYRIIDVSFAPVAALVSATFPRFFQQGSSGLHSTLHYAKRQVPRAAGYGLCVMLGTIICAPVVPRIIGNQYGNIVEALRWLSPLPLLRAFHYFLGNALTGAGFQGVRSAIQVLVAILNVGLVVWLLPLYSWRGAAWASIASDGMLVVTLGAALLHLLRRRVRSPKPLGERAATATQADDVALN